MPLWPSKAQGVGTCQAPLLLFEWRCVPRVCLLAERHRASPLDAQQVCVSLLFRVLISPSHLPVPVRWEYISRLHTRETGSHSGEVRCLVSQVSPSGTKSFLLLTSFVSLIQGGQGGSKLSFSAPDAGPSSSSGSDTSESTR